MQNHQNNPSSNTKEQIQHIPSVKFSLPQQQPIVIPKENQNQLTKILDQIVFLKEVIAKISIQLQNINDQLKNTESNGYQKNKRLQQQRRALKKQLLDTQYLYQKTITLQKQYQYKQLYKQQRLNVEQLKKQLQIQQQKILRSRQQQLFQLNILRQKQRIKDGILGQKIYQPDNFVYDIARIKHNENLMLEHQLVNICQYYKQTGLSNCPIYGYKRYKSTYKYNGINKYNGKKYF